MSNKSKVYPFCTAPVYVSGGYMSREEAVHLGPCIRSWDNPPKTMYQARFPTKPRTDEPWTLLPQDVRPQISVGESLWTFAFTDGSDWDRGTENVARRIHASLKDDGVARVDVYALRTDDKGLPYYHFIQSVVAP